MNVGVIYSLIGLCQPEGCALTHFMFVFRTPQLLTATVSCIFHPVRNFVSSLMLKSELNKDQFVFAAIMGQISAWTLMEL